MKTWLAAVLLAFGALAPQTGTIRVRVAIQTEQQVRPVPRHALLISENPTSAAPQRAVTSSDGTAEIRVRPGNYTVESDEPLLFQGKSYEWRHTVDVPPGQTVTIDFNAANAEVADAAASPSAPASASGLLLDWQNSVVEIWTPLRRGAGFLVDRRGVIATNQRLIGRERSVEVQVSRSVKVAARVLAADAGANLALLWIDPQVLAPARPVRLGSADAPPPAPGDRIFAINVPMEDDKNLVGGSVRRISSSGILSDIPIADESLGAPVFNASGVVFAVTTAHDDGGPLNSADSLAVRIDGIRPLLAAAEKTLTQETPPSGTRLPVEGEALFPDDPLREAAAKRKGPLGPYRISAENFDVSVITPLLTFAARHQGGERAPARGGAMESRDLAELEARRRALQEFGNWWDYVRRDPPVLMIRATPKMVEPFWKTVLRGAAQSQGMSLPPIKQIKAGFARMRLACGGAEVTPIHPFKIEHRLGESEAVYEGFYVYDPAAIGPQCGTVTLTLYSDKAPDKGDARPVDAKILGQIHEDFAPYRAAAKAGRIP
ncbi:MAG TPA: trypsin-like peptidase domain-containing protein [Vicinamibacterales bacterium]|nr:trypsin-like peptidase domain-containing protein [Vicinamibacterales bacterium]